MATHLFAKKYLFDTLGITAFEWGKMRDGYDDGSGLISVQLHTTDLIKIGQLLLRDGNYNDQQIVSKDWVRQILSPTISYQTDWGFDNSTYSLCWYKSEYKGTKITYAMGWGGQFLIVIPSMNAVVAINQNTADATAIKQSINFIKIVFPAIYEQLLDES
jgi:CubicO group peptidase (beta-lactamase class C family)